MSDLNQGSAADRVHIPFKMRLKAWWGGYELKVKERPVVAEPVGEPEDDAVYQLDPNLPEWETARVHIAQKVWGDGFNMPGREEHVLDLVKPFGLDETKKLLHLGGGLGGGSRAISKEFNTWVSAFEADEEIATAGKALSEQAGMVKKAPVGLCNFEEMELEKKSYDCALATEIFFGVRNKEKLFKSIAGSLKSQGHFMFTDFVVEEGVEHAEQIEEWTASEQRKLYPWSLSNYEHLMRDVGFDVRVMEDISSTYAPKVVAGFKNFISHSRECVSNKKLAEILVNEVELWTRRSAIMEKGAIKLYRFYVIGRKETKLMSDW
ncbi:methyltransferase domain-containing protein [Rhodovibrionaceae bacterium A322]